MASAQLLKIHKNEDSKGIEKLKDDAKSGGEIAGGARVNLEKRLGRSIVTEKNFLDISKTKKLKKK